MITVIVGTIAEKLSIYSSSSLLGVTFFFQN